MTTTAPLARTDLFFRAFADPTRLRLLNLLQAQPEACVCDLVSVLGLPQAKVSRHLGRLREAGLVHARREGPWMHYRLAEPGGAFHEQILGCLGCCLAEVSELRADRERLAGTDLRGPGGCCR